MKAKDLLADPAHWTKGALAKDKFGVQCWHSAPEAACWCLEGAIRKCYPGQYQRILYSLPEYIQMLFPGQLRAPFGFNDNANTNHSDVLKLVTELDI